MFKVTPVSPLIKAFVAKRPPAEKLVVEAFEEKRFVIEAPPDERLEDEAFDVEAFVAKNDVKVAPSAERLVVDALPIYAVPEVKSVGADKAVEDALTVKNEAKRNVVEPRPHTPSPVGVMFPFTCMRSVGVLVPTPKKPKERSRICSTREELLV